MNKPRISPALIQIRIEYIVYPLIACAAAVMRFSNLGNIPLSPAEAQEALAVWRFWQPGNASAGLSSPAYLSLTAFFTQIFGFSDTVMRVVPALFGLGIVLLPWFLRHRLGRYGAIIVSLLLAFSPVQSLASGTAGGQTIALFSGFLLFVSWLCYHDLDERRWLISAACAIGLGLLSSPIFYSLLTTMGLAWLGQRFIGPRLVVSEKSQLSWPDRAVTRQLLLVAGTLVFLLGTSFFMNASGLGSAADLFAGWLGRFLIPADVSAWLAPQFAVARFEPILLLFGLPAVVWAIRQDFAFPGFSIYWFVAVVLLIFTQRGEISNLLVLTLPGYLLVAVWIDHVFVEPTGLAKWAIAAVITTAGAIIVINMARYSRIALYDASVLRSYNILLLILVAVAAAVILSLIWSWDRQLTQQGMVAGFLILLLIYGWGTGWWLSKHGANDTRGILVASAADDDIRLLADTLREISWQTTNSATGLSVAATVDSPTLAWYLRDFSDLEVGVSLPAQINDGALITPLDTYPTLENQYIGADFGYLRPDTVLTLTPIERLRWWLFHEASQPVAEQRVILWIRADLIGVES